MLVYNHYKVHCKVQEELLKGAAPPPSAGGAPWPYPPSCSLKVVQVGGGKDRPQNSPTHLAIDVKTTLRHFLCRCLLAKALSSRQGAATCSSAYHHAVV